MEARRWGGEVADLTGWLEPLTALTQFPKVSDLTADVLRRVVQHTSKKKAAGADGWTYKEVSDWTPEMYEALCAVLALVERMGQWPSCIGPNVVCLLPKGGTSAPGDRRPIVLLSVFYRIWAAARS